MPPLRRVFLGSATEHLPVVERLQQRNPHSRVHYCPWTDVDSIRAGEYTLPALLATLSRVHGAVFLCFDVDSLHTRNEAFAIPRDNVMFEAGVAYGLLGRERTLLVTNAGVKLPSDLHGLNVVSIPTGTGVPIDWTDTIHSAVQTFFDRVTEERLPLSYFGPDRAPLLTPALLMKLFPESSTDVERAFEVIERGRYAEAARLLGQSEHLLANYLRCRLAVISGSRAALRAGTTRLIAQAFEAVQAGSHDAYFFFEISARRLIKTFDEIALAQEWLERMRQTYEPPDLHHLRGLAELNSGHHASALIHYDRAIAAGSKNVWTHIDRLECLYRTENADGVMAGIEDLQRLWPDNIHAGFCFRYLPSL